MIETKASAKILELLSAVLNRVVVPECAKARVAMRSGLKSRMQTKEQTSEDESGFTRMQRCRDALAKLDERGWKRSYHQRLFHDDFLKACTRIFWKLEPAGAFARQHLEILQRNNWTHISQEVLVSTPRRFGKTISVSMFAAAMLYSAPNVEISIYSTCKRISQKLLRNVQKFFSVICNDDVASSGFTITRSNMEEMVLKGPASIHDLRIVNSYPSKVAPQKSAIFTFISHVCNVLSHAKPAARQLRVRRRREREYRDVREVRSAKLALGHYTEEHVPEEGCLEGLCNLFLCGGLVGLHVRYHVQGV